MTKRYPNIHEVTEVIGGLVVNWSNNESIFLAIFIALMGCPEIPAVIVWESLRSTRARLELISRLAKNQIKNEALLTRTNRAVKHFKGATPTRNFYCHSVIKYKEGDDFLSAIGYFFPDNKLPNAIDFKLKKLDVATVNEIVGVTNKLNVDHVKLWDLLYDIEKELGVSHQKRPSNIPKSSEPTPPSQKR